VSRPGRTAWVAVLALPALAFGARLLRGAHEEGQRALPERTRAGSALEPTIWTAADELAGLGRIAAHLAPLHADPTRQAFEAAALRGRVVGLAGEPYLLQLEIQRGPASAERLDPATVTIEDEAGIALRVPSIPVSSAVDPIATLLRPPAPLAVGERASFVLFGREPGAGARLVLGDGRRLALASRTAGAGESDSPIASIDRKSRTSAESSR